MRQLIRAVSGDNLLIYLFSLELEICVVAVQRIHQNSKNGGFCEELLSENDFEAVLANFCCHDHCVNASEAVQKIATDQQDYHKHYSCVIVFRIAKIYQSITLKKGWLAGHLRRS